MMLRRVHQQQARCRIMRELDRLSDQRLHTMQRPIQHQAGAHVSRQELTFPDRSRVRERYALLDKVNEGSPVSEAHGNTLQM